jgi:hypothetical protein
MPIERRIADGGQRRVRNIREAADLSGYVCIAASNLCPIDATAGLKTQDKAAQNIGQTPLHSHAI